jgi:hypothetical protein
MQTQPHPCALRLPWNGPLRGAAARRSKSCESVHSNGGLAIHRTQRWTHGFASPPHDGFACSGTKSVDSGRRRASRDGIVRIRGRPWIAKTNMKIMPESPVVKCAIRLHICQRHQAGWPRALTALGAGLRTALHLRLRHKLENRRLLLATRWSAFAAKQGQIQRRTQHLRPVPTKRGQRSNEPGASRHVASATRNGWYSYRNPKSLCAGSRTTPSALPSRA